MRGRKEGVNQIEDFPAFISQMAGEAKCCEKTKRSEKDIPREVETFFDELMKTVPPDQAPIFVSVAQNLRYLSVVVGPLLGTALADHIGLSGGLFVGAALRFAGCLLFALGKGGSPKQARAAQA